MLEDIRHLRQQLALAEGALRRGSHIRPFRTYIIQSRQTRWSTKERASQSGNTPRWAFIQQQPILRTAVDGGRGFIRFLLNSYEVADWRHRMQIHFEEHCLLQSRLRGSFERFSKIPEPRVKIPEIRVRLLSDTKFRN
uniref:Uncharacterized protein n=1 Tax=Rhizobium leguminosarum TaxID=384 RepID=A0A179BX39_RHILE|nr:hypothetical protein A4U53_38550 [Rhizobium leguminosarum]